MEFSLPSGDDTLSSGRRQRLWARIDVDKKGFVSFRTLVERMTETLIENGVVALAGHTPEAFAQRTALQKALASASAGIQLWRAQHKELLDKPDIGIGRLGPGAVEAGPEFTKVLFLAARYYPLDRMFKELDDGDRSISRKEFTGPRGLHFWKGLGDFLAGAGLTASFSYEAASAAFDEINGVISGSRFALLPSPHPSPSIAPPTLRAPCLSSTSRVVSTLQGSR